MSEIEFAKKYGKYMPEDKRKEFADELYDLLHAENDAVEKVIEEMYQWVN